jgi:hypothetical protein
MLRPCLMLALPALLPISARYILARSISYAIYGALTRNYTTSGTFHQLKLGSWSSTCFVMAVLPVSGMIIVFDMRYRLEWEIFNGNGGRIGNLSRPSRADRVFPATQFGRKRLRRHTDSCLFSRGDALRSWWFSVDESCSPGTIIHRRHTDAAWMPY